MTAREYLEEIERQRVKIDNFRKEIDDLRASINLLPGVTYDGDHVQTSTTDSKVLEAVTVLVDKERNLAKLIEAHQQDRAARIMAIHKLADSDHMTVLYQRYVDGRYWWEIAQAISKNKKRSITERWVYKLHEKALEELEAIL